MTRLLQWLALPDTTARWASVAALQAGGFFGWLSTPSLWVFCGPFRWMAMLGGMASQESAYDRYASGDDGLSIGILQFSKGMWTAATGYQFPSAEPDQSEADDPRVSPFQSGYVAAKYVRIAMVETPRWWTWIIPLYGFAVMRYMWTCGVSDTCAQRPAFDSDLVPSGAKRGKWNRMWEEGERASGAPTRGYTAFLTWRLVIVPVELCVFMWGTGTRVSALWREAA